MKEILTLVGVKQARVGYKFRFIGQADECNKCNSSLKNICIKNLEKNHVYEVIEVRGVRHECSVHAGGVKIVKVIPVPIKVAIEARVAFEGTTIQYQPLDCNNQVCEFHQYCVPIEFEKNKKVKCRILKVEKKKKLHCKKFSNLALVEIEKI